MVSLGKYSINSLGGAFRRGREDYRRKGAFFSIETAFYFIVIAIIAAVVIGIFNYLNDARVSTAEQELDQLRSAVLEYKAYRVDQSMPANLSDLLKSDAITAQYSIDNRQHGPFLNTTNNRWSTAGIKDPWGNDYKIDGSDTKGKYIYSTAGSTDSTRYIKSYISAN